MSSATWLILAALAEMWAIYGVLARVPAEIATNIPNGALCLFVVLLVARQRGEFRAYIFIMSALGSLILAFAVCCSLARADNVEATVAVVASCGLCLPQLYRSLTDVDLNGLSPASWVLNAVAAVSWALYGLAIAKVPIYLPSLITVPMSVFIAARARSYRARSGVASVSEVAEVPDVAEATGPPGAVPAAAGVPAQLHLVDKR